MEATGRMLRLGEDKAVEAQGHPVSLSFKTWMSGTQTALGDILSESYVS